MIRRLHDLDVSTSRWKMQGFPLAGKYRGYPHQNFLGPKAFLVFKTVSVLTIHCQTSLENADK